MASASAGQMPAVESAPPLLHGERLREASGTTQRSWQRRTRRGDKVWVQARWAVNVWLESRLGGWKVHGGTKSKGAEAARHAKRGHTPYLVVPSRRHGCARAQGPAGAPPPSTEGQPHI